MDDIALDQTEDRWPAKIARGTAGDVVVPPHIWVTVPGTCVQVHHEAEGATWCRPCPDGSLILRDPAAGWSTRPMPAAQPRHTQVTGEAG